MFQNNPINYDGVDLGRNRFIVLNDEENHKKFLFDTKSKAMLRLRVEMNKFQNFIGQPIDC